MHKLFRRTAATVMTAVMLFGNSSTALAAKDDATSGPGVGLTQETQAPETQPAETQADSGQAADGQSTREQNTEVENLEGRSASDEEALRRSIEVNTPYLQVQVLTPDMNWTPPVVGDGVTDTNGAGFRSMCIYLNNIVGNVLYRTYSANNGWTNWAMNGSHTDTWADGSLVEAFQIRFSGFSGNKFDVYYCSTLSDGTQLDWASNGKASGAMATGKYITGFRLSLWAKEDQSSRPYTTSHPLDSATDDGVQLNGGGVATFSSGTGAPYTGWAWNDRDRYYFVDNQAVTGWQYVDGYKYYFDETGKVVTDLEPIIGAEGPFMLRVNKEMNTTTVYTTDGENGYIIPLKSFLCSCGDDTPIGTFRTPEKYRWRLMNSGVSCQYATRLGSGLSFLLHSIIYDKQDVNTMWPETYNYLGVARSAGCIRFTSGDAKWIFDHCPVGTTIEVYNSPVPGPYDRPAIEWIIPMTQHWDPTDPVAAAQFQQ